MFKRFSINYMVLLFLIDSVLVQLGLAWAIHLRFVIPFGQEVRPEYIPHWMYVPNLSMYIAVGLLWAVIFLFFSCYTPRRIIFWIDEFQRITMAHTMAALSLSGLLYLANIPLLRLIFAYFYMLTLAMLLGYRIFLRLWHRFQSNGNTSVARILVVGAGPIGQEIVSEFKRQQWPGIEFVGFVDTALFKQDTHVLGLPVLGKLDDATDIVRRYHVDEIIVALPRDAHAHLANLVARLHELPVRLRIVPDYFDLAYHGATVENLGHIPLIGLRDPAIDGVQRFAKRLLDVVVALITLILTSPLLALVALLIKLEDGGPIFYRAARVGENGKLFYMLKFRSMVVNAEQKLMEKFQQDHAASTVFHKKPNDPRVTRIGRLLRRTSIDELPQLFNVLHGEMSLVGPRPELPMLVKEYATWQRKRFAVPQGITGWWQINGRSDNPMHLHTDQDLYYIQHYSLWLDLQILWRTIGAVIRGKGAY
ncbi:MAG: sugar transferase [Caldilineaceae bacterium]